MLRVYLILLSLALGACASSDKSSEERKSLSPFWMEQTSEPSRAPAGVAGKAGEIQVFYGEPRVPYKKVCKIETEGSNAVEQKYTKKADFEGQFKRRARRCRGANAVIIQNMFAFERGSAFADGAAIRIDP